VNVQESASDQHAFDEAARLYSTASKVTSETWTHKAQLSSEAKRIFASQSLAQQYRVHVRQQRFYRTYLDPVKVTCDATKEITGAQADHLLTRAESDGWKRDEAAETLFRAAWELGWRVFPPTASGSGASEAELRRQLGAYTQERRRYEEQLREAKIRKETAERQAEAARQQTEAAQQREKAAAQRADAAEADRDALKQRHQIDKQRFEREQRTSKAERERLERELRQAQRQEAQTTATLTQELDALKQLDEMAIRRHIADAAPLLASHMAQAEYVAAHGIIKEFATRPPQWADDARRIERGITEAQRLLGEAQRAERISHMGEAESLIDQALAVCADLPQAQAFKVSLRPEAPGRLEARVEQGSVALTWMPSPSREVRYVIVRSAGKSPLSAHDGAQLVTVDTCAWRDEHVPPAQRFWYAVFAERGSAISTRGATTAAPVLLAPDALDAQVEGSDAAVTLSWRLPRGVRSIRVVRNDTYPPQTPDDGDVFTLGETTHFEDTHLINGCRYHYRIYCEYDHPDGGALRSESVTMSATPTAAPASVPELTLHGANGITNHTVIIEAPAPAVGTLAIYRTRTEPALGAGARVPTGQHEALLGADCHKVDGQRDMLFQPGAYYYVPVVLYQRTAYIGATQTYRYFPPVRQLKAQEIPGQGIELRWIWPKGCDTAETRCVAVAPGVLAQPVVALVARTTSSGSSEAVYMARDLPRGVYTLTVLARYQVAGQIVYSNEETREIAHVAPVRVRYALEKTQRGLLARTHMALALSADEPVALPGFQVVYGHEPLTSPANGHLLAVFAGSPSPTMTLAIDLSDFTPEPGAHIFVFPDQSPLAANVVFDYAPMLPRM
jgi:hypothetical protein